jgi:hypothetical protein
MDVGGDSGCGEAGYANLRDPKSWEQLGGAAICVLCAALAAGLTVVSAE